MNIRIRVGLTWLAELVAIVAVLLAAAIALALLSGSASTIRLHPHNPNLSTEHD